MDELKIDPALTTKIITDERGSSRKPMSTWNVPERIQGKATFSITLSPDDRLRGLKNKFLSLLLI